MAEKKAEKKQRIEIKITDLETGTEQMAGEFRVIPGFCYCCYCSCSCCWPVVSTGPVREE
jgi:hypothetical protein